MYTSRSYVNMPDKHRLHDTEQRTIHRTKIDSNSLLQPVSGGWGAKWHSLVGLGADNPGAARVVVLVVAAQSPRGRGRPNSQS